MKRIICLSSLIILFLISTSYSKTQLPQRIYSYNPQPDTIKVMSFNVKTAKTLGFGFGDWSSRKPLVFDMISEHIPDIFGLQEPVNGQHQDIQKAFGQYASYSEFGAGGTKGQTCPIFWRKDRFMLLDSGTFWFSQQPDEPGSKSWGLVVPRFCSWVKLSEKGRDSCFYVYNVHLDSVSQNSREKSVRLLAKEISQRKSQSPFIIMGDFNMKLMNPAMEFLMQKSSVNKFPVIDAWLSVHPEDPDASTCNFGGWGTGPQLDHIALGLGAKPVDVEIDSRKIDGRYPSDHFPVIARVTIPPEVKTVAKLNRPRTVVE